MEKNKSRKMTNLQRMQRVVKGIVPYLCKCKDYMDVSLHFGDINNEFVVVSVGSVDDSKNNKYRQFWFYSSSNDETLKEKVDELKKYVELNYL